ncbi:MAG TPA: RNase adapter RapZ, partial [Armatimonadota bacterium]|nr:RNase adapter RapZ [Armatimonadota bacterium]
MSSHNGGDESAAQNLVIITGLSGAGKSQVIHCLEDLGYYCVDNMPPSLVPQFAELCAHSQGRVSRLAVVMDIRGGYFFQDLFSA